MKQKVLSFWKVKSFGINGFPIYREYIERFKILFFETLCWWKSQSKKE